MIQLTDYLGATLNIDETVIVTVENYSQNGVAGSKVEYRTNPNSISVIYVTDIPSAISGLTPYVAPITLVFDNGQTEVIYINPVYYRSFQSYNALTVLLYEYQIGSVYRQFITSTSQSAINAQIAAINSGGSGSSSYVVLLTNNGTSTYDSTDIDFSIPSGLITIVGATLQAAFISGTNEILSVTDPVLPAPIGTQVTFSGGAPAGDIILQIIPA